MCRTQWVDVCEAKINEIMSEWKKTMHKKAFFAPMNVSHPKFQHVLFDVHNKNNDDNEKLQSLESIHEFARVTRSLRYSRPNNVLSFDSWEHSWDAIILYSFTSQ